MNLATLAERVEGATVSDPQLVAEIRAAVFAPAGEIVLQSPINGAWCVYHGEYKGRPRSYEWRGLTHEQRMGDFMSSLDAAMSLLPKADLGMAVFWKVGNDGEGGDPSAFKATVLVCSIIASKTYAAVADTPALALTAAALRALAQAGNP